MLTMTVHVIMLIGSSHSDGSGGIMTVTIDHIRPRNLVSLDASGFRKLHPSSPLNTQLDEQYVKRSQLETELMNERHDKELETLKAELEGNMRELHEIQVKCLRGP